MQDFSRYPRRRFSIDPLAAEKAVDLVNLMVGGLMVGFVLGESSVNVVWFILVFSFAFLVYFVILPARR
jgi:hypothetical protein